MDTIELAARIRRHALRMTSLGGSSHVGSVFSMADIVAVLYGSVLSVDPQNPRWPDRDRLILSKGHAGAGIYAALAERGFFPVEMLDQHCADGSILSGHVSHKGVPGVELSTGSLGHGLGVAAGIALAGQRRGAAWRTFVIQSDGECDEGSVWEAALFAGHHRLDRLVVVVDYNKIQSLRSTTETLDLEPFADKWKSFGWHVIEADGHDHGSLRNALGNAAGHGRPTCVIADTVKGKGVSFMEHSVLWHYRTARGAEYDAAARELGASS